MSRIARYSLPAILCAGMLVLPAAAQKPTVAELLEKGIYQENALGDLDAALATYRQIIRTNAETNQVASEAKLRVGLILLKKGKQQEATKVLRQLADTYPQKLNIQRQLQGDVPPMLGQVIDHIQQHYVDEFESDTALNEAALQGVLGNLDAYSNYMNPEQYESLTINTTGKLVGIGVILDLADGKVKVKAPLAGSPAAKAGLVANDTIAAIGETAIEPLPQPSRMPAAIKAIRGKKGTDVVLTIERGEQPPFQVTVRRDEIHLTSVTGASKSEDGQWQFVLRDHDDVGYIRIAQFNQSTKNDFRAALNTLANRKLSGLIIDLRNNGGGILDTSLDIADMFLADGKLLDVKGRDKDQSFTADASVTLEGVPIAVLVNRNTASSAEILAGALKDRQRAIVIGGRTFGKGTVQRLFPLDSGGAITLTTARFYLPSGAYLEKPVGATDDDRWGVDPSDNCRIESTDEQIEQFNQYRTELETFGKSEVDFDDQAIAKALEQFGDQK